MLYVVLPGHRDDGHVGRGSAAETLRVSGPTSEISSVACDPGEGSRN